MTMNSACSVCDGGVVATTCHAQLIAHSRQRPTVVKSLGFVSTTLGAAMMSGVFKGLYIVVFLEQYKLPHNWFYLCHVVYMIWNAVNDPLFAWIQEKSSKLYGNNQASNSATIAYGGPAFALSFLLPWFPWGRPGSPWVILHFFITMCAWDAMYTWVLLAHSALFADVETSNAGRSRIVALQQVAHLVAASGPFIGFFLYDPVSMTGFRIYCVFIAVFAAACFRFTGAVGALSIGTNNATTPPPPPPRDTSAVVNGGDGGDGAGHSSVGGAGKGVLSNGSEGVSAGGTSSAGCGSWRVAVKTACGVLRDPHFFRVVAVNFAQVFNVTANENFHPILLPMLVGSAVTSNTINGALGMGPMVSHLLTLTLVPLVHKHGTSYYVIRGLLLSKLMMCGFLATTGHRMASVVLLFSVFHCAASKSMFQLITMSLSDVVDEDMKSNKRKRRAGNMIFGLNALVTKPAQSLAPMLVLWILSRYGYDHDSTSHNTTTQPDDAAAAMSSASTHLAEASFQVLYGVPAVCGIIQLLLWSLHTLRGTLHEGGGDSDGDGAAATMPHDKSLTQVTDVESPCVNSGASGNDDVATVGTGGVAATRDGLAHRGGNRGRGTERV